MCHNTSNSAKEKCVVFSKPIFYTGIFLLLSGLVTFAVLLVIYLPPFVETFHLSSGQCSVLDTGLVDMTMWCGCKDFKNSRCSALPCGQVWVNLTTKSFHTGGLLVEDAQTIGVAAEQFTERGIQCSVLSCQGDNSSNQAKVEEFLAKYIPRESHNCMYDPDLSNNRTIAFVIIVSNDPRTTLLHVCIWPMFVILVSVLIITCAKAKLANLRSSTVDASSFYSLYLVNPDSGTQNSSSDRQILSMQQQQHNRH